MNNKPIDIALEVNASNYSSSVEHLASEFVYMDRIHNYSKKNTQIDVFGTIWIVGFANLPENKISIKNGNDYVSLSGPCGFFAPPFSIVEWKIEPGELKLEATLANCELRTANCLPAFKKMFLRLLGIKLFQKTLKL